MPFLFFRVPLNLADAEGRGFFHFVAGLIFLNMDRRDGKTHFLVRSKEFVAVSSLVSESSLLVAKYVRTEIFFPGLF